MGLGPIREDYRFLYLFSILSEVVYINSMWHLHLIYELLTPSQALCPPRAHQGHIAILILLEMGRLCAAFKVQGAGLFHSAKVQFSKLFTL